MEFIDFFAGVGGFRRGMELAGHKCVGFCEFDQYATASYISMHCITDEQRAYLATLSKKDRQKEILKDEYRNGEWFANDIRNVRGGDLPVVGCWTFGAPCQDFSIAGLRRGLDGERSSLVGEIFRCLREIGDGNRPEWLIYENVKGMLSSNRGFDFAFILAELDECGYDAEWYIFNSKDYGVPQSRERVYLVGHSRKYGEQKILFDTRTNRQNCFQIKRIGGVISHRERPNRYRVYDSAGIAPTLDDCGGGGREPHIVEQIQIPVLEATTTGWANCTVGEDSINFAHAGSDTKRGRVGHQVANTLDTNQKQGVFVRVSEDLECYAVYNEQYDAYVAIRKLTPRECFRLQGWTDEYFERAEFVNSDAQLYKQAGNGVTVNVVYAIASALKGDDEHEIN